MMAIVCSLDRWTARVDTAINCATPRAIASRIAIAISTSTSVKPQADELRRHDMLWLGATREPFRMCGEFFGMLNARLRVGQPWLR